MFDSECEKFKKEKLIRFSITVPEKLLEEFENNFQDSNRSEHIRDLMRQRVVSERWKSGNKKIFATVTIVYDHHTPELARNITAVQHDNGDVILCSTHVHINHTTCLECIITKGNAQDINAFIESLQNIKGIKSLSFSLASEL